MCVCVHVPCPHVPCVTCFVYVCMFLYACMFLYLCVCVCVCVRRLAAVWSEDRTVLCVALPSVSLRSGRLSGDRSKYQTAPTPRVEPNRTDKHIHTHITN